MLTSLAVVIAKMGCSSSDEEESSFTELESKKTERKEKGMKRNINIILFGNGVSKKYPQIPFFGSLHTQIPMVFR